MSSLTPDQIKTLEQSRQRLVQLTHSLASLITSLNQSDPLPSWTSLQSQATIISNNLLTISDHLSDNRDLLATLVAYPSPSYPSRNPANTVALEQLLRTKLDPRVEDWVARGRKAAGAAGNGNGLDDLGALAELWDWAPVEANQEARRRNWGGNFTLEEREQGVGNVVTGLRRVLEDDDDDSESEEGESGEEEGEGEPDEMEIVGVRRKSGVGQGLEFDIAPVSATAASGPGHAGQQKVVAPVVPLDEILRFMTVGIMPSQR
ncbi:RNA polymerase II mediator complex subunit MED8 [Aspergillus brunneoviolaceus CBS 621.78]|uniref:Mediator of RNA polymerase II transcription subunit 8 n=1 Tax=Aspergillus brunneoviolaceus CBS 621.78 TaxID=1450534 RepID=A0ACD1GQ94_9EURO|nr:putative mediator of RNA polymerase II transcription subunit 8 [Aspergillus brunneoviolaceus CBS 621.78]RAH51392.1 putative mediator of RNA polymerase II transcription subunit 8 [Aspergillus brunneoviolaceus CBS 621.78]